jgi:hypothetical protein
MGRLGTAGLRGRRKRRVAALAALLGVLALVPAAAAARPSASATLSYVGNSTFVLTVSNTGPEAFEGFNTAVTATNLVPASACENKETSFACRGRLLPGEGKLVCFTDAALSSSETLLIVAGSGGLANEAFVETMSGPALSACPIAAGPEAGRIRGKQTPAWSRARCIRAYKAWRKKHRHATRRARTAEGRKLRKQHGCRLSASVLR